MTYGLVSDAIKTGTKYLLPIFLRTKFEFHLKYACNSDRVLSLSYLKKKGCFIKPFSCSTVEKEVNRVVSSETID